MAKSSKYKDVAMQAAGAAGGFMAAAFVGKQLDKFVKVDAAGTVAASGFIPGDYLAYAKAAVQAGGGIFIASKYGKNKIVESAGVGMAARGVLTLLSAVVGTKTSTALGISGMTLPPQASLINGVAMRYDIDAVTPLPSTVGPFDAQSATIGNAGKEDGGRF
jgi:hypothetical protein